MAQTPRVSEILGWYSADNPGTKTNLARMLMHGRLGGTGKLVILPVDQGVEHGPARSFAKNSAGYDPRYHFQLAIDAGLNAFAAPLGMLEAGAAEYAGQIPLILKVNGANSHSVTKDAAVTASVRDALRLGCVAVGFTIYPGSADQIGMIEELRELAAEAKACGLVVVVWSYPRGGNLDKRGETALDVTAYAAHLAAEFGAHIIKVKPPTAVIAQVEASSAYEGTDWTQLSSRIAHVVESAFGGRRIVIFSGGEAKGDEAVLSEIRDIAAGGGFGSIIGRNAFQRLHDDALTLLGQVQEIYRTASV